MQYFNIKRFYRNGENNKNLTTLKSEELLNSLNKVNNSYITKNNKIFSRKSLGVSMNESNFNSLFTILLKKENNEKEIEDFLNNLGYIDIPINKYIRKLLLNIIKAIKDDYISTNKQEILKSRCLKLGSLFKDDNTKFNKIINSFLAVLKFNNYIRQRLLIVVTYLIDLCPSFKYEKEKLVSDLNTIYEKYKDYKYINKKTKIIIENEILELINNHLTSNDNNLYS